MKDMLRIMEEVFSNQTDTMVIFEPVSGKALYWNKAFLKVSGYTQEETSRLRIPEDLFSPEDALAARQEIARVMEKETAVKELTLITKSGEKIPYEYSGSKHKTGSPEMELVVAIGRDMRQVRERERKLNESTALLQMVLDNIPQYVFWKDRNLNYLGCNNNFARGAGFENPSQLTGKSDFDMPWSREQAEFYRKVDREVMESGIPQLNIIEPQTNSDGKNIWLKTNKIPFRDQHGNIAGVMGNYEEITEGKMINDSLEILAVKFTYLRGSEFFENLCLHLSDKLNMDVVFIGELNELKDGVVVSGFAKHKELSKGFSYQLKGSPCEHVIGKEISVFEKGVSGLFPGDESLLKMGIESYIGCPLNSPEGEPLGILVLMDEKPLVDSALKLKILSLFSDRIASEIQRSRVESVIRDNEEKYRKLIEQSKDAIYILFEGRFVMVNQSFISMFGYSEEELTHPGFHMLQIVAPGSRDEIVARSEMLSRGIEPKNIYEFTALNKAGEEIECQASISYVDFKGKKAAQGIVRDISERKKYVSMLKKQKEDYQDLSIRYSMKNQELRESIERIQAINSELEIARDKAEESDRLKSAFLANMSHEIRTPMNGIIGFANILKNHDLNMEKQDQYLEIIETSGQRMLNLINDLIDISKIEAGLMELTPSEFNLNRLIHSLHEFFLPMARMKDLIIEAHTGLPEEKSVCMADENKLHQVLVNLINNAIKFTRKGSVIFGYRIINGNMEFRVSDTGPGIDKKIQDKIFERFRQGELSFSKDYEGAGLGLAISKALVQIMGGTIWLESEPGNGSVFYFSVPFNRPEKSAETHKLSSLDMERLRQGLKILIAEDDDVSYELICEMLSGSFIKFYRAKNGLEAVQAVSRIKGLDLVLMDIKLPVMNGIEATRKIKELYPGLPVIMQSAFVQEHEKLLAANAGCDAYLTKPIHVKSLVSEIARIQRMYNSG